MLSQCANSHCGRPFLQLGEGKLFLVETEYAVKKRDLVAPPSSRMRKAPRRVQRYWLCDQCAEVLTLVQNWNEGIVLLPLLPPSGVAGAPTRPAFRQTA